MTSCVGPSAEAELGARPVRFVCRVVPEDLTVTADPARLAQLVANLLDNAARHSPPVRRDPARRNGARRRALVARGRRRRPGHPRRQGRQRLQPLRDRRRLRRRHGPRPRHRLVGLRAARRLDPRPAHPARRTRCATARRAATAYAQARHRDLGGPHDAHARPDRPRRPSRRRPAGRRRTPGTAGPDRHALRAGSGPSRAWARSRSSSSAPLLIGLLAAITLPDRRIGLAAGVVALLAAGLILFASRERRTPVGHRLRRRRRRPHRHDRRCGRPSGSWSCRP